MEVCFIGHRKITPSEELIIRLKNSIVNLIEQGATIFLFGSKSGFDDLAWKIVTKLKKKYPAIKRLYVRAIYKEIDKSYESYLLQFYDETYFPIKIENAGKFAYVERNFEMINRATFCVFYYDENYTPRTEQTHKFLPSTKRKSGTKIAYEYAIKKKKIIINLFS